MKKSFVLEDLDCAHCAAKMEEKIKKLKGVISAEVSFLSGRLILEADDDCFDKLVREAAKICRKIEPDCRLITD